MSIIDFSCAQWRKSSHSNDSGSCVEVATAWRTSSYCGADNACVEVGQASARVIVVRDTTDRDGAMLAVTPAAWRAFTSAIRHARSSAP